MKFTNPEKLGAFALVGILSLLTASATHAALVLPTTPEIPGVALGAPVANFGGTVETGGNLALNFTDTSTPTNFTGSLRSTVVRNAGGTLDFYYQLANTTVPINIADPEIFRLTLDAFPSGFSTGAGGAYEVFNISNGLTGITGAGASVNGTNAAFSGDRQVGVQGNGVGFDWGDDHFIDDTTTPANLAAGETANFLVVRTNATQFRPSIANVIGAGTASVRTFVPVPEPATVLMGLALTSFVGCAEFGRNRRRKPATPKA